MRRTGTTEIENRFFYPATVVVPQVEQIEFLSVDDIVQVVIDVRQIHRYIAHAEFLRRDFAVTVFIMLDDITKNVVQRMLGRLLPLFNGFRLTSNS